MAIPKYADFEGKVFAGDIEANGFLMEADKVWCIVCQDVETEELFSFHDYPELCGQTVIDPYDGKEYTIPERTGSLLEGARFWYTIGNKGGQLAVHNAGGYDKWLLEKFWPKCQLSDSAWVDTLIQSKIQWYDRGTPKGAKGIHGLQAWGCRFNINKPDIDDWTKMDAFMLHRCIEDVYIQTKTYKYLKKERASLKEKLGIEFEESYLHEWNARCADTRQELVGAKVDEDHIDWCIEYLDTESEKLRKEVEPQLPPTLKAKTQRISLSEMGELLGIKKRLVDETEKVVIKGEWVERIKKPFFKPSVNYLTKVKSNQYKGVHSTYGNSPVFDKRVELSQWVKDNFPKTKLKDWNPEKIEIVAHKLNHHTTKHFDCDEWATDYICGSHTRIEWIKTEMSQHDQVKKFLLKLGWKPDEWNYKKDPIKGGFMRDVNNQLIPTSPKLTESSYESLPEGLGLKIAHYNTYMHRRRFLANPEDDTKGIKNHIRPDGRITCGLNNSATSTLRYSQSVWVNPAGEGALFGEEIRKVIVPEKGKILVGADMKSAQLSIAAYYANNKEYYDAVADGQEVSTNESGEEIYIGESGHCVNARMFTLVSEAEWQEAVRTQDPDLLKSISLRRKKSKGGSFSTLFGASGKKVASTMGIPENLGEAKKKAFLQNIGLDRVIEILKIMVNSNSRAGGGYIELPFGYHVWCNQPHKMFNYLDQGTEAACQKIACNYFEEQKNKLDLNCARVLSYHDEFLVESDEDIADDVGKLMSESYEYASEVCWDWHKKHSKWFKGSDCPSFMFNLDGGYKKGYTYLETH